MATTPATAVAGVMWDDVAENTHTTAIKEIQQSGVLLDLTSTAQCDSTGATVAIAGFSGSYTITGSVSRRVQLVMSGLYFGTAVGSLVTVQAAFGTASVLARAYIPAVGGNGVQDCDRCGRAAVLSPGTYSVTASVSRTATAGTGSLGIGAGLQVIDIGPA